MITEVGPKRPQLLPCYEEVIAPIDPSHTHHRALDTATMFSRMAKVPLILVAVDTRHRDARSALNDLASTISDVVVDIEVLAPSDHPGEEIRDFAASRKGSMLCMPTPAYGRLRETLLHPTSSQVLAGTRRPVVLVGPRHRLPERWSEIAAFVDESKSSEAEVAFAGDLALQAGLPLTVMQVLPPVPLRDESDVCESAGLRRYAAEALRRGQTVTWDALHDKLPKRGIASWLEARPTVLAVLGCHGQPARSHFRSPSVAAHVVHETKATVVVVPADISSGRS